MTARSMTPLLLVAACHLTACADTGASGGQACSPAMQGGAAPPRVLSADQTQALRQILARYKPDRLDAAQAKSLREALCKAALPDGPALHKAMAELGFSAKQLALMSNSTPDGQSAERKPVITPSGRVVPPRP